LIGQVTDRFARNKRDGVPDEMEVTSLKSSHSTTVKEALDASAAVFDASGQQIAQATAALIRLGMAIPAVQVDLEGTMTIRSQPRGRQRGSGQAA
jgi:N-methylhydantoinase B